MSNAVSPVDREIESLLKNSGSFPTSIHPSTADRLFELTVEMQPDLVVEIGCFVGFSTLHIAKALQSNGKGSLYAFDLSTDKASSRIARADLAAYVRFVEGNSSKQGKVVMESIGQQIDILFIDGDHTRRGCMRDLETFLPYLRTDGVVVFHDTHPKNCCWSGPRYAVEQLRGSTGKDGAPLFDVDELQIEDPYGVAVCRKLANGAIFWPRGGLGYLRHLWSMSRVAQFMELAEFEGKKSPLQKMLWGISKLNRVARHW